MPYDVHDRKRELPGREPLIVPPTAAKSTYYSNPIIRQLWTNAFESLRGAAHIAFMGYSLPSTDLTFNSLLLHALRGDDVIISIADLAGEGVRSRLRTLGLRNEVRVVSDSNPIQTYVEQWCSEVASRAVQRLRCDGELDHPMLVPWGENSFSKVRSLDRSSGRTTLILDPPTHIGNATRTKGDDPMLPTLSQALSPAPDVITALAGTDLQHVVDLSTRREILGYGDGLWNVLMTSGPAPSVP